MASGQRRLSPAYEAWVGQFPLTGTCCLVEEQKHHVTALCCLHRSTSTARQATAFVLWVEGGQAGGLTGRVDRRRGCWSTQLPKWKSTQAPHDTGSGCHEKPGEAWKRNLDGAVMAAVTFSKTGSEMIEKRTQREGAILGTGAGIILL